MRTSAGHDAGTQRCPPPERLAVVYLPPAATLFHTVPLPVEDWLVIGALNALALAAIGLIRSGTRRRRPRP